MIHNNLFGLFNFYLLGESLQLPDINVKELIPRTNADLTADGHRLEKRVNQPGAGIKPKRVSALIQRGALR